MSSQESVYEGGRRVRVKEGGWSDAQKGPLAKKLKKAKKQILPCSFQKEHSPDNLF